MTNETEKRLRQTEAVVEKVLVRIGELERGYSLTLIKLRLLIDDKAGAQRVWKRLDKEFLQAHHEYFRRNQMEEEWKQSERLFEMLSHPSYCECEDCAEFPELKVPARSEL